MDDIRPKPQPLNVEIGKREADAMFRRRDLSEAHRRFFEHLERLITEGVL